MASELRQFICRGCPGKYTYHRYRLWYERVDASNPFSQCHVCEKMVHAVPRGEEEGVHICKFACQNCEEKRTFVVRCKMSNTAPCYSHECLVNEVWIRPHSFQGLRRINRKSDSSHLCDEPGCKEGKCPNMKPQPGESHGESSCDSD